jgi:hypothetical protein
VRAGYGPRFSVNRYSVSIVQFPYVVSGHKIKIAEQAAPSDADKLFVCFIGYSGADALLTFAIK